MERIENKTLFSLKFIACLFVVFIHVPFPGEFGEIMRNLARFAVPLFFMISGYYTFFKDKDECNKTINKRIIKLLKITLCACAFYFLVNIIFKALFGRVDWYFDVIFSKQNLYRFALFNSTNWLEFVHLWYMFAIIYVYLIFKLINKFNLHKIAYVFSIIAIIGVLAFIIYAFINEIEFDKMYFRNAYLFGLPFFMLGHLIHAKEDKIKAIFRDRDYLFIIFALLIIAIFIIEQKVFGMPVELYISSVLLVLFMFCYAICHTNISIFYEFGKYYSLNIYIIHSFFQKIINQLNIIKSGSIKAYLYPLIVFLLSLLTSMIYQKYIKKMFGKRFKEKTN